jgi:hypothetical protein
MRLRRSRPELRPAEALPLFLFGLDVLVTRGANRLRRRDVGAEIR